MWSQPARAPPPALDQSPLDVERVGTQAHDRSCPELQKMRQRRSAGQPPLTDPPSLQRPFRRKLLLIRRENSSNSWERARSREFNSRDLEDREQARSHALHDPT